MKTHLTPSIDCLSCCRQESVTGPLKRAPQDQWAVFALQPSSPSTKEWKKIPIDTIDNIHTVQYPPNTYSVQYSHLCNILCLEYVPVMGTSATWSQDALNWTYTETWYWTWIYNFGLVSNLCFNSGGLTAWMDGLEERDGKIPLCSLLWMVVCKLMNLKFE